MATTVHGVMASPYVMNVVFALHELGVDYEFVLVDIGKGDQRQPEFLAKNPFGQVPFFEDGDVKLYESRAIVRYLADKYDGKGPALYGKTLAERALVEQWLEVNGQNFNSPAGKLVRLTAFAAFSPKDDALFEKSIKDLGVVLDIYDQRLQSSKYLAGDFFSLADLVNIPITYLFFAHSEEAKKLINDRKHVKAWWEDVTARPAWKKVEQECAAILAKILP
eukprot:TRINITY_DN894_c0_g3_i1.p1 TRINITY_DN894_c0_g3~~TRINITY_DN894_c0_g3_i1.p1  ORF type:complete len:221 (+),score=41.84 TRINITY_DN894_c0_g3_i1:77-739(+)